MDVEANTATTSMVDILPPEVLATILSCVAKSSLADLFRCKLSCKTLRRISEEKGVIQQIHLPWVKAQQLTPHQEAAEKFFVKCVENEHPEALLEFGFRQYFNTMVLDEGLTMLSRANELHNPTAAYVLSLIYIYTGEEERGVKLLKKTINSIGSVGIVQCRRKLRDMARYNMMRNHMILHYLPKPKIFCKHKLEHEKNLNQWDLHYDADAESTVTCMTCKCVREICVFYEILVGHLTGFVYI
ncbi:putative F-box protein At1g67623 [Chenopodium quinoa]|uniref:putative F-box protein At1g67623 n=1 Tax=Chenopodium quinoa TaxID=63459 RepID=UPI000B778759|nr:putative F-box protein At1g67623 [Chenopodium quinoa]